MIYNSYILDGTSLKYRDEITSPGKKAVLKYLPSNDVVILKNGRQIWSLAKASGNKLQEDVTGTKITFFELKKDTLRVIRPGRLQSRPNLPDLVEWKFDFVNIDPTSRKKLVLLDDGNLLLQTESAGKWVTFWSLIPVPETEQKNSLTLPLLLGGAVLLYYLYK